MALGQLVVAAVFLEGRPKAEVARSYGVSRRWVHELCRRYQMHGEAGLRPASRRPHRSPHQTPAKVEDAIVSLRKLLSDQGLDAGAHTIAFHLSHAFDRVPSVATIWRILQRRGFVVPQPQKRPKSSYIRFCADQPNERWQADITHWELADGTGIEICNILDDHSRLIVGSTTAAGVTFKAADVVAAFHQAVSTYGLPAGVLTDNGAVFTAAPRGGGRCTLELELARLGVGSRHSRPYHPQTCGKVERYHQTLKKWLDKQPRAMTLEQLQAQLDRFTDYYNTKRPHRALGRRTPSDAYTSRPKASPPCDAVTAAPHLRVRRDRVDTSGVVTLRHNSRLHHIGVGRAHRNERVLILVADLDVRIVNGDGEVLRHLTLDPSRDYQPQG
jgi:transposase InsO family protein